MRAGAVLILYHRSSCEQDQELSIIIANNFQYVEFASVCLTTPYDDLKQQENFSDMVWVSLTHMLCPVELNITIYIIYQGLIRHIYQYFDPPERQSGYMQSNGPILISTSAPPEATITLPPRSVLPLYDANCECYTALDNNSKAINICAMQMFK